MKRTPTKVLILLVLLAATLFLTGCAREPLDPTADKGSWGTQTFAYNKPNKDPSNHDYFTTDANTQIITFEFDPNSTDLTNSGTFFNRSTETPKFMEGYYKSLDYTVPYADYFIGFEATVKKESGKTGSGYGFDFFYNGNTSKGNVGYYRIELSNGYFLVKCFYKNGNSWETDYLTGPDDDPWVPAASINPVGQENRIKVRSRNDGKVEISINETLVGTITPKKEYPTAGKVSTVAGVEYYDTTTDAEGNEPGPVKITWKFKKFQQ